MRKLIISLILIGFCTVSLTGYAETPMGEDLVKVEKNVVLKKINKALLHLLKLTPKHHLVRKEKSRQRFSKAIYTAAKKSGLSWATITSISSEESAFYPKIKSKVGAIGVMQLKGRLPWKHCAKVEGRKPNRNLVEDHYICGAHWLRYSMDYCDGSLRQGMTKYMTRAMCKPKGIVAVRVARRFRIIEELKNI